MEFYSLEVKRVSYQKPKDHKNRLTKPRLVGLRTVVKTGNLGRAPNLSFLSSFQGRACYSWQGPSSTILPISFLIFLSHTWQLPSLRLSWSNNKGQILDSYFRKFKPFPGSKPWALIGIHLIHNQRVPLIALTLLPGAGYQLHTWSTHPTLLTHTHKGSSFTRLQKSPHCHNVTMLCLYMYLVPFL